MNLKKQIKILLLSLVFGLIFVVMPVFAQEKTPQQKNCDKFYGAFQITLNGKPTDTIEGVPRICTAQAAIATVIELLLKFSAVVAVLFLMIGGFWYLTSAGNEEQSEKGRKTITSAAIGLVVILMAYAIVRITANLLISNSPGAGETPATTNSSPGTGTNNPNTPAQTTQDPNSMYSLVDPSVDIYDNKEHLASISGQVFNSGGQQGFSAWTTVSSSNKQAILQIKTACGGIDPPFLTMKTSRGGSERQDFGQVNFVKQSDGNWKAEFSTNESTSLASVLEFWICQGPQFKLVTIPGR